MKTFPASRLEGNARIADGKLILDGSSYLWAARDAKLLTTEAARRSRPSTPAFRPCSTRRAPSGPATCGTRGSIWHDGTYYLYYLAKSRGQWDNISMARSPDGVHWKEIGRVLSKGRGVTWMGTGSTWKSPALRTATASSS